MISFSPCVFPSFMKHQPKVNLTCCSLAYAGRSNIEKLVPSRQLPDAFHACCELKLSVNPHFFFFRLQVRPRESRARFPTRYSSTLLFPHAQAATWRSCLFPTFHHTLVYPVYFCKRSKKLVVTGKTKTTKGWASEREEYRSVAVVDCRAQVVYSCGLPICFFFLLLDQPCLSIFRGKNAQKMAHLNGGAKEGRGR